MSSTWSTFLLSANPSGAYTKEMDTCVHKAYDTFTCEKCGATATGPRIYEKWRQRWIDEKHGGLVDAEAPCRGCGLSYKWPFPGNPAGLCAHCTDGVSHSWAQLRDRKDAYNRSTIALQFGVDWWPWCGNKHCDGTCDNRGCVLPHQVVEAWRKPRQVQRVPASKDGALLFVLVFAATLLARLLELL